MTRATPTIEAAALRLPFALVMTLPRPARHGDIMRHMSEAMMPGNVILDADQGFLTSDGRFLERIQAAACAVDADQITAPKWGK